MTNETAAGYRRAVVVLVGLTLIGSCSSKKWLELDAQGYAEYDQCIKNQPVPLPEGTYADASITLDYERQRRDQVPGWSHQESVVRGQECQIAQLHAATPRLSRLL